MIMLITRNALPHNYLRKQRVNLGDNVRGRNRIGWLEHWKPPGMDIDTTQWGYATHSQ